MPATAKGAVAPVPEAYASVPIPNAFETVDPGSPAARGEPEPSYDPDSHIEASPQVIDVFDNLEPSRPSKEMLLLAELQRRSYVDEVQVANREGTINLNGEGLGGGDGELHFKAITHKRARQIWLYKPTGEYTAVPGDNYLQCLEDGWTLDCPDCHTNCKRADWGCARLPEPRYRLCPICGMKFHELKTFALSPENADPLRIIDDEDERLPEMDSRGRRDTHVRLYHEQSAASYLAPARR